MKFSDKDLLESLKLNSGDIYSEQEFNLALYNLNSKYMDEGYYFINIANSVVPLDTNKLNINFTFNESEKTKIRKIIITTSPKLPRAVSPWASRGYPEIPFYCIPFHFTVALLSDLLNKFSFCQCHACFK